MTRPRRPWHWLPLELRAPWELAAGRILGGRLAATMQGQQRPVLIIPGFGASDRTVAPLHRFLRRCGYRTYGWSQGRNLGTSRDTADQLRRRIEALRHQHRQPIAIIGWSLGGVFARELARQLPDAVAHVITLGSPIGGGETTTIAPLFALANPNAKPVTEEARQRRHRSPPVRCTAIFSRSDGIVPHRCAHELPATNTENIVVRSSHFGLIGNPMALYAIADRLQNAGPLKWPRWMRPPRPHGP